MPQLKIILWYSKILYPNQVAQIFQSYGFDIRYNIRVLKIHFEWAGIAQSV
jgi:hypothetical protein